MKSVLSAIWLLAASSVYAEVWDFQVGAGARFDENIGFAPDSASERDDITTRAFATVTWNAVNTAQTQLAVAGTPFVEAVVDLEDLSNLGASLGVSVRHQFSEAFTAPALSFSVTGTYFDYEDSEIRDGHKLEAEIALAKAFSPKFGATIGYRYNERTATESRPEGTINNTTRSDEVFDTDADGPFVKVDFTPAPRTTLFLEYMYLDGDVVATGDPINFQNGAQFARARDFAFEEGARFIAWKIPAEQDVYSLGWTQAITDKLQLAVTGNYLDASSDSGNDYNNTVYTAELVFNW